MVRILGPVSVMLLGIVIGVFSLAYIAAGTIYEYEDTFDPHVLPEVDVIICLAGGRGRISEAARVWHRYFKAKKNRDKSKRGAASTNQTVSKLPVLYVSGMGANADWDVLIRQIDEKVLKDLTVKHVVIENESENTYENARWLAHYATGRGWRQMLLVTASYHMKRAYYIFLRVLWGSADPSKTGTKLIRPGVKIWTHSVAQEPFQDDTWRKDMHGIRVTLTEYLKWVFYRSVR